MNPARGQSAGSGPSRSLPSAADKLPHRFPFVLFDCPVEVGEGSSLARRRMTIDEALLEGHAGASFVQNLLVEAMAQTAALFAEQSSPSESGLLAGLSRIRFGRAPRTGDSLMVEARLMQRFGDLMRVGGRVTEAGECLAEGEILISLSGGRQRAADPAPLL